MQEAKWVGPAVQRWMVERWMRRYRRWRLMAVIMLLWALASMWPAAGVSERLLVLRLEGEMHEMVDLKKMNALLEDSSIQGILVLANSPGGLPGVAESWSQWLARFQQRKIPVVVWVQDVCASGCYLAVAGADRILANQSSLVGSIGAMMAMPNFSALMKQWQIEYQAVTSGPLKSAPNPWTQRSPKADQALESLVSEMGQWFVKRIAKQRGIQEASVVEEIRQGGVFLGPQALRIKLVDELCDVTCAIDALKARTKSDLPLEEESLASRSWWEEYLGVHMRASWRLPQLMWPN